MKKLTYECSGQTIYISQYGLRRHTNQIETTWRQVAFDYHHVFWPNVTEKEEKGEKRQNVMPNRV